ncbi:hypothetical protein B0H21DRAFT_711365 [Amylocystis lapponica]|nr:hypothetical protein B0H21DRAFT_711365 [Amylocystis lapponica]
MSIAECCSPPSSAVSSLDRPNIVAGDWKLQSSCSASGISPRCNRATRTHLRGIVAASAAAPWHAKAGLGPRIQKTQKAASSAGCFARFKDLIVTAFVVVFVIVALFNPPCFVVVIRISRRTSCYYGFGRRSHTTCDPQGSSKDAQQALRTHNPRVFNSRRQPFSLYVLEDILQKITVSGHGDLASSAVCLWADNQYLIHPPVYGDSPFLNAMFSLKARAAVKTKTYAIELALMDATRDADYLDVDSETRIPIVESFTDLLTLGQARAALVRDEGVLVVCADTVDTIGNSCNALEARIYALVSQRVRIPTPADVFQHADSHLLVDSNDKETFQFIDWSSPEPLPELPTLQATEGEGELPIPSPPPTGYWLGVEMSYESLLAGQRLHVSPFRTYAEPYMDPLSSHGASSSSAETTPPTISPWLIGPPPAGYGMAAPDSPFVYDDGFAAQFEMDGEYEAGQKDNGKGLPETWAFGAPMSPIGAPTPAPFAEELADSPAIPTRARKRASAKKAGPATPGLRTIKAKPKAKAARARQTAGPAGLTPLPGRAATNTRRQPFPAPFPPPASGSRASASATSAPKANTLIRAPLLSTRVVGQKAKRVDYNEDDSGLEEDGLADTDDDDEYVDDVHPTKRTKTTKAPSAAVGKSATGKKTSRRRPGTTEKFTCEGCGKPCRRKTDLNRHLKSACKAKEAALPADADEDLDGEGEPDEEENAPAALDSGSQHTTAQSPGSHWLHLLSHMHAPSLRTTERNAVRVHRNAHASAHILSAPGLCRGFQRARPRRRCQESRPSMISIIRRPKDNLLDVSPSLAMRQPSALRDPESDGTAGLGPECFARCGGVQYAECPRVDMDISPGRLVLGAVPETRIHLPARRAGSDRRMRMDKESEWWNPRKADVDTYNGTPSDKKRGRPEHCRWWCPRIGKQLAYLRKHPVRWGHRRYEAKENPGRAKCRCASEPLPELKLLQHAYGEMRTCCRSPNFDVVRSV